MTTDGTDPPDRTDAGLDSDGADARDAAEGEPPDRFFGGEEDAAVDRVACCLRAGEDRRLLVEWLGKRAYEPLVVEPEALPETRFDLCLFDPPTLRAGAGAFRERRERDPAFLPALLVADEDTTLGSLPEDLAPLVTDVLATPLRSQQLERRLESVLRARRLSRDLTDSRERYRRLVELTPEAVFVLEDGIVEYANVAGERLLERRGDSLRGEPLARFVADADVGLIERLLAVAAADGSTAFRELEFEVHGRAVPVEVAGARIGVDEEGLVQLVVRDVTQRKAREDQLRLYRRAMDAATVGISITDPSLPDNPLIYVNEEFERLAGRPSEELLGRNPRILQSPDAETETVARIRRAVDRGEGIGVEILNERADGSDWWNALDVAPITDADGEVEYFLGFQRDVTERRLREQRLAVLDRILRHNLRNRLNVVLGHAEQIAAGEGDAESHADSIREAAMNLLALSDAARRFRSSLNADSDPSQSEPIRAIVGDAARNVADDRPDAVIDTALPDVAVRSEGGLRFAVEEVIRNAFDHGGPDVRVSITAAADGDVLRVEIADTGPGIPTSEQGALTGGAETPVEHASGIGLWLVRWSVEELGGVVDYEANEPTGSVVVLELPLADAGRA